jgi:hypothetical protein
VIDLRTAASVGPLRDGHEIFAALVSATNLELLNVIDLPSLRDFTAAFLDKIVFLLIVAALCAPGFATLILERLVHQLCFTLQRRLLARRERRRF